MATGTKTHYAEPEAPMKPRCGGWMAIQLTSDPTKVDCKLCVRLLARDGRGWALARPTHSKGQGKETSQ